MRTQSMDLDRSSPVPMQASTSGSDDWELDPADIVFQEKIAAGAFGDLYKGVYCGQDVAIKILRNVQDDTQQYQEFLQARLAALAQGPGKPREERMLCSPFPLLHAGVLQYTSMCDGWRSDVLAETGCKCV